MARPEQDKNGVDVAEVALFSTMAADWWDPQGSCAPLHKLQPARLGYIRTVGLGLSGADSASLKPLAGLTALDVGCGGGLVTAGLARMGAQTTGLDAGEAVIGVARHHAAATGLDIDYRCQTLGALADSGAQFDLVTCLEVLEHVGDVPTFLADLARVLKPGGRLIFSTPNRTRLSYLATIVLAERILRWVPAGAHDWHKFITPDELAGQLALVGLTVREVKGLSFRPVQNDFIVNEDVSVNYIGWASGV